MSAATRVWLAILACAVVIRLFTLGAYALADPTEARYAEIARLMVVSHNWVTPQIQPGVPFWGKPPLSFWLTAGSFKLFGFNEFAARLPAFLLTILTAMLVFLLGLRRDGSQVGLAGAGILFSTAIVFVSAGAVMTDATLALGTTLAMAGFWIGIHEKHRGWGYLLFVGLAIGLLGKGPVALVLTALPIFFWLIWQGRWRQLWTHLPLVSGTGLTLALTLPWYLLAEHRSPGFLNYFLVGEHWHRFLDSGWSGDLYGRGHSRPRGTIWLFWLLAGLPWTLVILLRFVGIHRFYTRSAAAQPDGWYVYLLMWALFPAVFFTFAGNILPSYVLPGMPALALLVAAYAQGGQHVWLRHAGWLVPVVSLVLGVSGLFAVVDDRSQRRLVADFQNLNTQAGKLVYVFSRPYSASFYSRGAARLVRQPAELDMILGNGRQDFLALKNSERRRLPERLLDRLSQVKGYPEYTLYRDAGD